MSITIVDRDCALIAIDLQEGILGMAPEQEATRIVENTASLADAFHAAGLPVIWVTALGLPAGRTEAPRPGGGNAPGPGFAELDSRLPIATTDLSVAKEALNAFTSDDVTTHLAERGTTQVVITGLAAGMGVESTARAAFDAGFNVTIASDAVTDPLPERGANSFAHVFPLIAETGATVDVLAALRTALA